MTLLNNNFYSSLPAKIPTSQATGIFHKASASSFGFVSGNLPCLGESSFRPLFLTFLVQKKDLNDNPHSNKPAVSAFALIRFTSSGKARLPRLRPQFLFRKLNKSLWVPWLIHEASPLCMICGGTLALPDGVGETSLQPRQSACGRHRAGLTFSRPFVSPSESGSQATPGFFLNVLCQNLVMGC